MVEPELEELKFPRILYFVSKDGVPVSSAPSVSVCPRKYVEKQITGSGRGPTEPLSWRGKNWVVEMMPRAADLKYCENPSDSDDGTDVVISRSVDDLGSSVKGLISRIEVEAMVYCQYPEYVS